MKKQSMLSLLLPVLLISSAYSQEQRPPASQLGKTTAELAAEATAKLQANQLLLTYNKANADAKHQMLKDGRKDLDGICITPDQKEYQAGKSVVVAGSNPSVTLYCNVDRGTWSEGSVSKILSIAPTSGFKPNSLTLYSTIHDDGYVCKDTVIGNTINYKNLSSPSETKKGEETMKVSFEVTVQKRCKLLGSNR